MMPAKKLFSMIRKYLSSQFKKPRGLLGLITSHWMVLGNRKNYTILLKILDVQPNDKVLEIGYGPGIGVELLAQQCATCTIYGIDFSKLMYKKATARNTSFIAANRVKLVWGNFIGVDMNEGRYNRIFCLNVIYFWVDLQKPFLKIYSLLKENGRFCIYMAHPDSIKKLKLSTEIFNIYSIEEVVEALTKAGFSNITYQFSNGYYITAGN